MTNLAFFCSKTEENKKVKDQAILRDQIAIEEVLVISQFEEKRKLMDKEEREQMAKFALVRSRLEEEKN